VRWFVVGVLSVTVACGPAVPVDGDGTTSSGNDDAETTAPAPTTEPPPGDGTIATTASETTTTTGADSSDVESDDGGHHIQDPDGSCFTACDIQCDVWALDCPEGEKCMPVDDDDDDKWNRNDCRPLERAPGAVGDPCVMVVGSPFGGFDDCQLGAMCWAVDPATNEGTCAGFCMGSEANPVCLDGESCFIAYDGHVINCLPTCEPLAPACDPGFACVKSNWYSDPDPFVCIPESLVADRTAYADACDDMVDCGSGLVCVDFEHVPGCDTEKCCSLLCDPLAGNGCPELARGQLCVPFEEQPELGYCGF
jgi:hypothetical protein